MTDLDYSTSGLTERQVNKFDKIKEALMQEYLIKVAAAKAEILSGK